MPAEPEGGLQSDSHGESLFDVQGERQSGWDGDSHGDCWRGLRRDFGRDLRGDG